MLSITPKPISLRFYCKVTNKNNKLYSNTILLPQTKFPLKLENNKLLERDIHINEVIIN